VLSAATVGVITVGLTLLDFVELEMAAAVVFDVLFRRRVGFVASSFTAVVVVVVLFFVFFIGAVAAFLAVVVVFVVVEAFVFASLAVFGFDVMTRFFEAFVVVVVAGTKASWSALSWSDLLVATRRLYAGSADNGLGSNTSRWQLLVMLPGSSPILNARICVYILRLPINYRDVKKKKKERSEMLKKKDFFPYQGLNCNAIPKRKYYVRLLHVTFMFTACRYTWSFFFLPLNLLSPVFFFFFFLLLVL
jgi:hypothetical protein